MLNRFLPVIVLLIVLIIIGNAYYQRLTATSKHGSQAVKSLYRDEAPLALEAYKLYQGHYPTKLADMTTDKFQPKPPFTDYFTDYTARLKVRQLKDPLDYLVLKDGQDYKLCLKEGSKQCKSPADLFADHPYDPNQADYQPSGDFYRDKIRENTSFILEAYLYRYNKEKGIFPDRLDQLVAAFPNNLRPDQIVDIQTNQPHSYTVTSDKKDYKLCMNYEIMSLGCHSNSDYIRYAKPN